MGYELTKGTKLNNRYVIECTLGSGGFGTTYKAMDTLIDVPVAIKEYENSSEKDRKVAQREVKLWDDEGRRYPYKIKTCDRVSLRDT